MKQLYRKQGIWANNLKSVETFDGERIEAKVKRIQHTDEAIKDGAPEIYTDRADGVIAAYNIRTDRFEIAAEAMDKIHMSKVASRDNKPDDGKVIDMNSDDDAGNREVGES